MARYKLAYLHPAETDILGIVRFHAEQAGATSAREVYRSIREQIGRLQDFPMLGPIHPDPELAALGYRKLVLTMCGLSAHGCYCDGLSCGKRENGLSQAAQVDKWKYL